MQRLPNSEANLEANGFAQKRLLPIFELTEVCSSNDQGAVVVTIPPSRLTVGGTYHVRPKMLANESKRKDGNPNWGHSQFNLFPLVLDATGVPWAEANIWILSRLEGKVAPVIESFWSNALDLAAFRQFLDENDINWLEFPALKLKRPTYRFNGHLKNAVEEGEVALSTAKRRMATVIRFYRWLKNQQVLIPDHPPWMESERYVHFKNGYGFNQMKKVLTTDISMKCVKQLDPYDGFIDDGGKLRPLPQEEQEWLAEALCLLGNTEMTLIHLFGILTGARIQTILTFRLRHARLELEDRQEGELRFPIGPGTGIDTKGDKKMVLHLPVWFYRMLQTYAESARAQKRRERADGGDNDDQYLFLSVRSTPLYLSKHDARIFSVKNRRRHRKSGQGVRQFITERIIPLVQKKYGATNSRAKNFTYRFHDTRATFGMNLTDHQMHLVEEGKATLQDVREFVKTRMGHKSAATTDGYLQFRHNLILVRAAGESYESRLKSLAERAMKGPQ